jgi:LMBR1 domain-containing protein 1
MIGLFCFFLIPFVYFYYEEEDVDQARRDRIRGAFKYTSFFVAISIFLFLFALFLKPNLPPPKLDLDWLKKILMESSKDLFLL